MADVTGLIGGLRFEQIGRQTAVRVVTTGAGHFAFPQGHVGGSQHSRTLVGMTGKAGFFGILIDR